MSCVDACVVSLCVLCLKRIYALRQPTAIVHRLKPNLQNWKKKMKGFLKLVKTLKEPVIATVEVWPVCCLSHGTCCAALAQQKKLKLCCLIVALQASQRSPGGGELMNTVIDVEYDLFSSPDDKTSDEHQQ